MVGRFGSAKSNPPLKIEITSGLVKFYVNNNMVYSTAASSTSGLSIAAVIYNKGGSFTGLTSSIDHSYYVHENETDISASVPGVLTIQSKGKQTGTDEFYWGDTFMTDTEFALEIVGLDQEFLDLLGPTPYETFYQKDQTTIPATDPRALTVHYPLNSLMESKTMWMTYPLEIASSAGVTEDDRKLTADINGASALLDGVIDVSESGWLSFQAGARMANVKVGLIDALDGGSNPSLLYGWAFKNGLIKYFDSGAEINTSKYVSVNDEFSVSIEDGNVNYEINGVLEATVPMNAAVQFCKPRANFSSSFSYVKKVKHSGKPFSIRGYKPYLTINHFECDGKGTADASAYVFNQDNFILANLIFRWTELQGNVYQDIGASFNTGFSSVTFSHPGEYRLQIEDANSVLVWSGNIDIGYKHDWLEESNAFSNDFPDGLNYNYLDFNGSPSAGSGASELKSNIDGWVEYKLRLNASAPAFARFSWVDDNDNQMAQIRHTKLASISSNSYNVQGSLATNPFDFTSSEMTLKVKRKDGEYSVWMNHANELINVSDNYMGSLEAAANLYRINIVKTHSSYSCAQPQYANLSRTQDGSLYRTFYGRLYFKYINEYTDDSETYDYLFNILNQNNETIVSNLDLNSSDAALIADLGKNYLTLDVNALSLPAGIYTLEVENIKGEKQYLKFEH